MASSSNCIISDTTAKNTRRYQEYVEKSYPDKPEGAPAERHPSPKAGMRRWENVERVRYDPQLRLSGSGYPLSDFRNHSREEGQWSDEVVRLSPMHRRVTLLDRSIQLEKGEVEQQLESLFRRKDSSTELLKIIIRPEKQLEFENKEEVVEVLISGLKNLMDRDLETKHRILDHLAEISLYPDAASFLCQLFQGIDKAEMASAIVECHGKRGAIEQLLPIFADIALEKEKPDSTFRRGNQLSYLLDGSAVKYILQQQIRELVGDLSDRLDFELCEDSKDSIRRLAKIIEEVFPKILETLRQSPKLNSVLKTGCIIPIRKKFGDQENVEELVRFGVIDMVFVRGVCHALTARGQNEEDLSFKTRCRVSTYLLRFVNGAIPFDERPEINAIWKKTFSEVMQRDLDELIAHFTED